MNQYWWGNINKATKSAYLICHTCPKYNPKKPFHTTAGHFKLPNGPFEVWQMDFIQLPLSHGCKYVLVMVCMFFHWTEAFPCRQATASSVVKGLLERVIPTRENLSNLIVIKESILLVMYFKKIFIVWPVLEYSHCSQHPQSPGLIECIMKTQLTKFLEIQEMLSPKALYKGE